jgi:hypothetical protein
VLPDLIADRDDLLAATLDGRGDTLLQVGLRHAILPFFPDGGP